MERDAERIEHDDHAGEADRDGGPAPPADLLGEQRHRQPDHEEGCGEGDRIGVDQRHARKDVEEAGRAAEAGGDARGLQPRPVAAHDAQVAGAPDDDRDRQHRHGAAEQHELERPVSAAQRLHHGVHGAEQGEPAQPQVDAEHGRGGGGEHGALFGLAHVLP